MLALSIMLIIGSPLVRADEITVAVASNFIRAMDALIMDFEASSGHKVNVSYGSSGRLYAQIVNGAPFQMFFSADQEKPERLVKEGRALAESRFTYATGALVLWSSSAGREVENAGFLRKPGEHIVAMANPRLAPYGAAAMQVLEELEARGITPGKIVQGENISQTFQFVTTGNAQAGFIALSQVLENGEVRSGAVWLIPKDYYSPIRQDVVITSAGKANEVARQFLAFIKSSEAKILISKYGYNAD